MWDNLAVLIRSLTGVCQDAHITNDSGVKSSSLNDFVMSNVDNFAVYTNVYEQSRPGLVYFAKWMNNQILVQPHSENAIDVCMN